MAPYWPRSPLPTKLALVVAVVALLVNLSSYFGLGMDGPLLLYAGVHASIMLLGGWLLVQISRHHVAWFRRPPNPEALPPYPTPLWVALVLSILYAAMTLATLAAGGEGGPAIVNGQQVWVIGQRSMRVLNAEEYRRAQMLQLRAMSAVWLALAIATATAHDRVGARLQRFKASRDAS